MYTVNWSTDGDSKNERYIREVVMGSTVYVHSVVFSGSMCGNLWVIKSTLTNPHCGAGYD